MRERDKRLVALLHEGSRRVGALESKRKSIDGDKGDDDVGERQEDMT